MYILKIKLLLFLILCSCIDLTITHIEKKLHDSIMYSYVLVTWVYNVIIITKIVFTIVF